MNLSLITHLVVALAAAAGVWVFQDARMDAAVADVRLEQSNERLVAVTQARADERAITKTYQGALNDARTREALLRTELDDLHAASNSLRAQLSDAARRIAAAPPAAVAEYAVTVSELLADCSRERTFYAGKATGHASDVRTLREAWPVIPPRPVAGSTP